MELSRQLHNLKYLLDTAQTQHMRKLVGRKMAEIKKQLYAARSEEKERWERKLKSVAVDLELDEAMTPDLKELLQVHLQALIEQVRHYRA